MFLVEVAMEILIIIALVVINLNFWFLNKEYAQALAHQKHTISKIEYVILATRVVVHAEDQAQMIV